MLLIDIFVACLTWYSSRRGRPDRDPPRLNLTRRVLLSYVLPAS